MLLFFSFIITISVLVIVHEYGHYLFARLFKVKVLTFSIGFGPKLISFNGKHNEWRISSIPLGGYVRMLDEREGNVSSNEKHLAFNNKEPYQKILIAMAGPLFNIVFAILMYYFIGLHGVTQIKPVISSVNQVQIASIIPAKLDAPSQIISINGYHPNSWGDASKKFSQEIKKQNQIDLEIKHEKDSKIEHVTINAQSLKSRFDSTIYLETIGLYPIAYLPIIAYIEPNSVASSSGLKVGDEIIAINSKNMSNWFEIAQLIHDSPGEKLNIAIKRQNKTVDLIVFPKSKTDSDGQLIGQLGIMPSYDENLIKQTTFIEKYNGLTSLPYAVNECYQIIRFNLVSIYQIITGNLSLYNLGGPITIAKVGATAIHSGFIQFAGFLALISIGLAIMNLLPIPVLDGGHIIIYSIELLLGRKLSNSVYSLIFKLGFMIVFALSILAIYNDMMRL